MDPETIFRRSLSVEERLEAGSAGSSPASVEEYLSEWRRTLSREGQGRFDRRLEWSDLDEDNLPDELTPGDVDPENFETFETVDGLLDTLEQTSPEELDRLREDSDAIRRGDSLPFETFLLVFLPYARRRMLDSLGVASRKELVVSFPVQKSAFEDLERTLLRELSKGSKRTLLEEFDEFRRQQPPDKVPGDDGHENPLYTAYVGTLIATDGDRVLEQYPVLGRLWGRVLENWIRNTVNLLRRFRRDRDTIVADVLEGDDPGPVVSIQSRLSDPHRGQTTVRTLTFESGETVVYKPKPVELSRKYNELLGWLNRNRTEDDRFVDFDPLVVVPRDGYGWVECVEHRPCEGEEDVRHFYREAGQLLFLLYVLRTTDGHHGNFIASGRHLHLIDNETLLQPRPRRLDERRANRQRDGSLHQWYRDSIVRTGMLPGWKESGEGEYRDAGAFTANLEANVTRTTTFLNVNQDNMKTSTTVEIEDDTDHLPEYPGGTIDPSEWLDEIEEGFRTLYEYLLEHRDTVLEESPFDDFRGRTSRFLFRDTSVYARLGRAARAPENTTSGLRRSLCFEQLAHGFVNRESRPYAWPVFFEEKRSLHRLDVPFFSVRTDSTSLILPHGEPVPDYFPESGYEGSRRLLESLDPEDLDRQIQVLRGTFRARNLRAEHFADEETVEEPDPSEASEITEEDVAEEVRCLTRGILDHALEDPDGSLNWIGLHYDTGSRRFQFRPRNRDLYGGRIGIAFYFAALAHLRKRESTVADFELGTGDGFEGTVERILSNLLDELDNSSEKQRLESFATDDLGGMSGTGSLIYGLTRVGRFLDRDRYVEAALKLSEVFTEEKIDRDDQLDVIRGSAGAILSLLALHAETGEPSVLERAKRAGDNLLEEQVSPDGVVGYWESTGTRYLGFSHGVAGISHALHRLFERTRMERHRHGARQGIRYLRRTYDPDRANWPVEVDADGESSAFMTSWCHGSPGILLGLLDRNEAKIPIPPEIVENSLDRIRTFDGSPLDHLCCGRAGLLETLIEASDSPEASPPEPAVEKTASLVGNGRREGYRYVEGPRESIFSAGLMRGAAGIGYELLRLHEPAALPSLLKLE